jgi:transcriptional regulator with XRE-family HTH domain
MSTPKTLLEAVRESGLSLSEIARRSGLSAGNLSRWSRGELGISLRSAEAIAEALGLSLRAVKVHTISGKGDR